jgi:hypothetical protein
MKLKEFIIQDISNSMKEAEIPVMDLEAQLDIDNLNRMLDLPFQMKMLADTGPAEETPCLFSGWRHQAMNDWDRFNNGGVQLEFYPEGTYVIKNEIRKEIFQRRNPGTLREFISDMRNFGVPLRWSVNALKTLIP